MLAKLVAGDADDMRRTGDGEHRLFFMSATIEMFLLISVNHWALVRFVFVGGLVL